MNSRYFFERVNSNIWIILLITFLLISFFVFDNFWEDCINTLLVDPIVFQFIGNERWVIPICSIFIVGYYVKEYFFCELLNWNRIEFILIFATIYLFCFFSGKWDYSLIVFENQYTAWANIIIFLPIICEIIIIIKIMVVDKIMNNEENAELEIESVLNVEDSYLRTNMYATTYKTLKSCFYKESSFAFSITGLWGSGKTTFMNYLKEEYYKNSSVSVIEFEPWKNDTTEAIIRNFFTLLCRELRLYIPNVSSTLNEYIDLLLDQESVKPLKVVCRSLFKICNKQKDPCEDIKNKLEQSKHKIVVFIDDIDRLNVDEIKEVLCLIRNTANFPFVQFIVAYDREYVCETLKSDGIYNPELYLEKFFNAEISLPKSEERIICNELLTRISKTINTIWGISKDDTKIHDMVYYRSDDYSNSVIDCILVPKILYTIRDVIRFHNIFYLLSKIYKEQNVESEIEFQDLFFLELLHYRYPVIYSVLCNTPLLLLELNEDKLLLQKQSKERINNVNSNQNIEIAYDILIYLFLYSKRDNSMCYLRNYSKYFMYRLDNMILTTSEFLMLENVGENEFGNYVDQVYKTKYHFEFENQILVILNQILFDEKGRYNNVLYEKVYKIITLILTHTKLRPLRDEVSNAVVVHLNQLCCIDDKHLREMLKLFNLIDLDSNPTIDFNIDNFLQTLLIKENLTAKLRHQARTEELVEIIRTFLSTTSNVESVSSGLSRFIEKCMINNISKADLLIPLTDLSNI